VCARFFSSAETFYRLSLKNHNQWIPDCKIAKIPVDADLQSAVMVRRANFRFVFSGLGKIQPTDGE
jgi:hypothetical protein